MSYLLVFALLWQRHTGVLGILPPPRMSLPIVDAVWMTIHSISFALLWQRHTGVLGTKREKHLKV